MTTRPRIVARAEPGAAIVCMPAYDEHRFLATGVPTPREIHCLTTRLTDKADLPLKVEVRGQRVSVILGAGEIEPRSVLLRTIGFEYRRTETVAPWPAVQGELVRIAVRLSLRVHVRRPDGSSVKRPAFDADGGLRESLRGHTLARLEALTGLTGLRDGTARIDARVPSEAGLVERRGKVWIDGVSDLELYAPIRVPATFAALASVAIGQRRTYGYGAVRRRMGDTPCDRSAPSGQRSAHR